MTKKLREAAEQAEDLLAEIVRRHIDDLLPRENFWRECGAAAKALRTALAATADAPPEAAQKVMDLWDACSIRGIGVCSRDCEQGECDICSAFVELRAALTARKEG